MRHILRETWSGLKRNRAMAFAVMVTMWVSLSLFGVSVLVAEQVDVMKGRWYDKIEISVFLCTKVHGGATDLSANTCEPGQETTPAQRELIQTRLEANPDVQEVLYESKGERFADFQEAYKNSPIKDTFTAEDMQDSFRIKLKDPEQYEGVMNEAVTLPGVQAVQDLHQVLDPLFAALNALVWGARGLAALLIFAAAVQIANTIKLSAFTRRKELGIMRLVGASNSYITLPFVLESLAAAVGAIICSGLTVAALVKFVVIDRAKPFIDTLAWIGWDAAWVAILWIAVTGVALGVIPPLLSTRRYLNV
ncbi:MAG: permease-like cell division protein FtsX [Propionibacteriaceae bacterium]|jgi:cell division transport system permease protein|nr:permease-like cell division protein FtsX [Propionibacteriaceae bacterium]